MYHGEATQNRPVPDVDVSGQLGAVGEDGVVTYLTIMGQVYICHQPVVMANPRHTLVRGSTDIEGTEFTDGIAVADHQFTRLACVFFVLRHRTE